MYRCDICNRDFNNQHDRDGHLRSVKHSRTQARQSGTTASTIHTATHFHCCDCGRDFIDGQALIQHLRDKVHKPKQKPMKSKTIVCDLCRKAFNTKSAMKAHKASPVHRPLCGPVRCLGSQKCSKIFISPSAMLHHLESGACISGLTRCTINNIIVSQDTERLISSQEAIEALEHPDESWSILTPISDSCSVIDEIDSWELLSTGSGVSSAGINTSKASLITSATCIHHEITHKSPGKALFLCSLCPPESNRFETAHDLEKHSLSVAHAPKLFHCPKALLGPKKQTHMRHFSTLSGVAMHVESGACSGGKQAIRNLLRFVNERLSELGFRQISLLE